MVTRGNVQFVSFDILVLETLIFKMPIHSSSLRKEWRCLIWQELRCVYLRCESKVLMNRSLPSCFYAIITFFKDWFCFLVELINPHLLGANLNYMTVVLGGENLFKRKIEGNYCLLQ